jgi:hypothetical protein
MIDTSFLVPPAPPAIAFDPLGTQAKQIAIRNALAQGTLNDQSIQSGALELEQRRRDMAADAAFRAMYGGAPPAAAGSAAPLPAAAPGPGPSGGPSGGPSVDPLTGTALPAPPPAPPAAAAPGAPPAGAAPAAPPAPPSDADLLGVFGVKAYALIHARAEATKLNSDAAEAQGKIELANRDYWGSLAYAIKNSAQADGSFDPRVVQGVFSQAQADGKTNTPQFQQFANVLRSNPAALGQLVDQAIAASPDQQKLLNERTTASAKERGATLNKTKADQESAQKAIVNAAGFLGSAPNQMAYQTAFARLDPKVSQNFPKPADWTPATPAAVRQIGLTPQEQTTSAETAKRDANTAQNEAGRLGVERARLAMEQKKAAGALGALTPNDRAIAEKLSTGDLNPSLLSRMPNKEGILAGAISLAAEKGVNWSPQIYAAKKAFTDPGSQQAVNLGTISRIVGHIGRYETNSDKLGFAPVFGLAGKDIGGTATATAEDAHAIASELEKLTSGGVGSIGQTREWQDHLRSSIPSIRQRAVDEISHLIGSQYEGMSQSYKAATGENLPVSKFVSPAGQKWMREKGIAVGGDDAAAAAPAAPAAPALPHGIPELGSTFNGGKVLKVTRLPDK